MKLSKKRKKKEMENRDFIVKLIGSFVTVAWILAIWWPVEKEDLQILTISWLVALMFTGFTIIWMVATALSSIDNYTAITTIMGVLSGLFWIGPKVVCENFIDNWKLQSSGWIILLISEAVIAASVGMITASFKTYNK